MTQERRSTQDLTRELKVKDSWRAQVLGLHRKCVRESLEFNMFTMFEAPPAAPKRTMSVSGLKDIYLSQMIANNTRVYEGRVLRLTNIDVVITNEPSLKLIVEDEQGEVQRLSIYNADRKKPYPIGCQFSIIAPYLKIAGDGVPTLRVDDPNTIILHQKTKLDLCSFCSESNS
jgi:hypothetical protein